mgnify:CR=1 FL=1
MPDDQNLDVFGLRPIAEPAGPGHNNPPSEVELLRERLAPPTWCSAPTPSPPPRTACRP